MRRPLGGSSFQTEDSVKRSIPSKGKNKVSGKSAKAKPHSKAGRTKGKEQASKTPAAKKASAKRTRAEVRIEIPSSAVPFWQSPPSVETGDYWIAASSLVDNQSQPTSRCGKWLVFVHRSNVDELWDKVGLATMKGELGFAAKVSTTRPNPNASKADTHVICVYTYDVDDVDDVRRVRQRLRDLGIVAKIPYKTDDATYAGKYAVRGDKRISSFFE